MKTEVRKLVDIKPYDKNPRNNDVAVDAVAESIKQCTYISPIIVDDDSVILAGHTRYKALKKLGYDEADVVVVSGLTEDQKRKYRILDNKTNDLASWNMDLLSEEILDLDFEGFDFGFECAEPEVSFDASSIDDFLADAGDKKPKQPKTMKCPHCGEIIEI